jgi:hypothetical protein
VGVAITINNVEWTADEMMCACMCACMCAYVWLCVVVVVVAINLQF